MQNQLPNQNVQQMTMASMENQQKLGSISNQLQELTSGGFFQQIANMEVHLNQTRAELETALLQ